MGVQIYEIFNEFYLDIRINVTTRKLFKLYANFSSLNVQSLNK
jgi:hypothetical protein